MSALAQALAEHVLELAHDRGLDRTTLIAATGMPATRIDPVLDGRSWPCPREMQALAHALGVRTEQLIPDPLGA